MTVGADQISLRLRIRNGRIERVTIDSQRTTMAARILEGKTPREACHLLPLLFSLCSTAQLQAGLDAFEKSLGYVISPAHTTARRILLIAEGLSEHVTRIFVDWAPLAEIDSDVAQVRSIRSQIGEIKSCLFAPGENDTIGGGHLFVQPKKLHRIIENLCTIIAQTVFSQNPQQFLEITTEKEFMAWIESKRSLPTQCIKTWLDNGLFDGNWPTPQFLPHLDEDELQNKLDAEGADAFITLPHLNAQPAETGPFARQYDTDLIKDMVRTYGNGPLSRIAAKLVDLAKMLVELESLVVLLDQDSALFHTKALGEAVSQVEAVRGKLCHCVSLDPETDTIQRYRILAPTEWNFHPNGPLATALCGIDAQDLKKVEKSARIAILALDPCVASKIVIEED